MTPMKKLAMVAVLTGVVWAGLGSGGVKKVWAAQCGIGGCPTGYHAASYYCDVSCGLCVNVCFQATNCQPNGTSFWTCGSCPAGYTTSSRWCDPNCDVCGSGCGGLTNSGFCTKI